jgi:hypothetical protein
VVPNEMVLIMAFACLRDCPLSECGDFLKWRMIMIRASREPQKTWNASCTNYDITMIPKVCFSDINS